MADRTRICTVCEKQARPRNYKRGMCGACYQRWARYGYVTPPPLQGIDLFWSKVEKADGCWNWSGTLGSGGYGRFGGKGPNSLHGERMAHRIAYVETFGPIPSELVLDHLCRNRRCVNPRHLEAVTERVNILRGIAPTAENARKTLCIRGHEIDSVRLDGHRECSTCRAMWTQRRMQKRKARRAAR